MNVYAAYSVAALMSHIIIAKVYVNNSTCYYATYSLRQYAVVDDSSHVNGTLTHSPTIFEL